MVRSTIHRFGHQAGKIDKKIAEHLTAKGFRSPMGQEVLPNTALTAPKNDPPSFTKSEPPTHQ